MHLYQKEKKHIAGCELCQINVADKRAQRYYKIERPKRMKK